MAEENAEKIAAYKCGNCVLGPNCDDQCNDAMNFIQGKTDAPYEGSDCDRFDDMWENPKNGLHDIDPDETEIPGDEGSLDGINFPDDEDDENSLRGSFL